MANETFQAPPALALLLATAVLGCAVRPDKLLRALASAEFVAHVLLTLAALVFALTFRIDLEL